MVKHNVGDSKSRDVIQAYIDRHQFDLELRWERKNVIWNILRVPLTEFVNPTLKYFLEDRKSSDYDYQVKKIFFVLIFKK